MAQALLWLQHDNQPATMETRGQVGMHDDVPSSFRRSTYVKLRLRKQPKLWLCVDGWQ
jgi:hypothetical protein